jgi:hypothetical protein
LVLELVLAFLLWLDWKSWQRIRILHPKISASAEFLYWWLILFHLSEFFFFFFFHHFTISPNRINWGNLGKFPEPIQPPSLPEERPTICTQCPFPIQVPRRDLPWCFFRLHYDQRAWRSPSTYYPPIARWISIP